MILRILAAAIQRMQRICTWSANRKKGYFHSSKKLLAAPRLEVIMLYLCDSRVCFVLSTTYTFGVNHTTSMLTDRFVFKFELVVSPTLSRNEGTK